MYEIHVTVDGDIDAMKRLCDEFENCKMILIELPADAENQQQLMCSLWCVKNPVELAEKFAAEAANRGLRPVRKKIEEPFNKNKTAPLTGGQYYEFHFTLRCEKAEIFKAVEARLRPCRLSRSVLKKTGLRVDDTPETTYRILTLRLYKCSWTEAKDQFESVYRKLATEFPGTTVEKCAKEKAIYDDNVGLDNGWL